MTTATSMKREDWHRGTNKHDGVCPRCGALNPEGYDDIDFGVDIVNLFYTCGECGAWYSAAYEFTVSHWHEEANE